MHRSSSAMRPRLRLDVLIPTHNRSPSLGNCLASVFRAAPADNLDLRVTVICNACLDDSQARGPYSAKKRVRNAMSAPVPKRPVTP